MTFASRSRSGFIAQVELLLDDGEMRGDMSQAARELAAARSWDQIFARQFESYADLVTWWQHDTDNRSSGGVETSAGPAGSLFEAFANIERERPVRNPEDASSLPLRPPR